MINCKVLVRVTVQVERQFYGDHERPVQKMFRDVAADAVSQVHRELGPHATIVGKPEVECITTVGQEVDPKPEEPKP